MNRRQFLSSIGILVSGTSIGLSIPNDNILSQNKDLFEIFSSSEIKKRFGTSAYVSTPVFIKDGVMHCIKTYQLELRATHDFIHNYFPKNRNRMCEVQFIAKSDIVYRLKLNYIHSVRFGTCPFDPGPHMEDECRWVYPAYVRGVRI